MKKIIFQTGMAALTLSIFLISCGVGELNKKAEETSNHFMNDLQKKDYTSAIGLCSAKAFEADTKDSWKHALERNTGLLGDIKTFSKANIGVNIATSTQVGTTVNMVYDVQWQYGKSLDSVVLIKEKDGSMKVYSYGWKVKNAKYLDGMTTSEQEAEKYMQAIKTGNYDAATAFCSEAALHATPKDKWVVFLNSASSKMGSLAGYSVLTDSSRYHIDATGDSGEGNYYDIFVRSDRGGNKVMEKIVFFQKNYDEPVKLAAHFFM